MKPRAKARSARELDLRHLLAARHASDEKLREAIVTAFSHRDGRVLVAFGELLDFVAPKGTRRTR